MNDILKYIDEVGQYSFNELPLTEIDSIIFTAIAYFNFTDIVSNNEENPITLEQINNKYLQKENPDDYVLTVLKKISTTNRFKNNILYNYWDITNNTTQFASIHIEFLPNNVYIAFRGTDDTIVGWREDFEISYKKIPAQTLAIEYINKTININKKYYIGGHSKGGYLAIYSCLHCNEENLKNIINIYNNDGPGLPKEELKNPRYQQIKSRITKIIPTFSIVGILLESECNYKIVGSNAKGFMQHDELTWQIENKKLVYKQELEKESQFISKIFETWINNVTIEERESFITDFFNALESNGDKLISEIPTKGTESFESILLSIISSNKSTKQAIGKFVDATYNQTKNINMRKVVNENHTIRNILLIIIGIFFLVLSKNSENIIGYFFTIALMIYTLINIRKDFSKDKIYINIKKTKLIIYLLSTVAITILFIAQTLRTTVINISIGGILLYTAWNNALKIIKKQDKTQIKITLGIESIIAFILGIFVIATSSKISVLKNIILGGYILAVGFINLLIEISKKRQ